MDRGRWKDRVTLRGCRQEQKQFKISFQQGRRPMGPTAFQSIQFQNCLLLNSCIWCSLFTQPQQSLSPPASSASLPPRCLIPTQPPVLPLGSRYKSFSRACANSVFLDWKYISEWAHFQLYNQPVVIPRFYPKAKVNTGKWIKIEKTEIQSPVEVSKKQVFSACPGIYQVFLQSWQSL